MGHRRGEPEYDVFLSHSHKDALWVEDLAKRLEDDHGLRPWLDRWVLIPGKPWQREIARGLETAASCGVFLSQHTPRGWFEKEIEKALNRQAQDPEFAVIPVLLPDADLEVTNALQESFLSLNTWVDFGRDSDSDYAVYLFTCGVKGIPPGRWQPATASNSRRDEIVEKLHQLKRLQEDQLVDDTVVLEKQSRIVDILLDL
jgi:hypothetical protein